MKNEHIPVAGDLAKQAKNVHQVPKASSHSKEIAVIKVPFGLAGARNGAELAPDELITAGLKREILSLGYRLNREVRVDCPSQPASVPARRQTGKHLNEVQQVSEKVCHEVSSALHEGVFPLVLGGDHSVGIGTLAGLTAYYSNLGVIWFDAHADLNTEEHSLTGNMHGMSLAAGLGHSTFNLSKIKGAGSFINPSKLVYIGLRDLDQYEKEQIRALGIRAFTMHDIDRLGMKQVIDQAINIAGSGTEGIHVSFDMDCLDPREAPGVGTPVPGGLSYREAHFAMECLALSNHVVSMELVEVNPLLDQNRHTARLGVGLIASVLGKTIL
ncbi:arginase [Paenibacillus barcinonensis]|uniref:Arginase n=1 Tax=Paenibacillus barcinonensis TaxID=198119 RepID=A0A2V4V8S7_PAEBA|nr:arginase [Paenibacillus barcinonensis]PYE42371.1 arginase [Paenibacillus barcinonensis]QKS58101.1 arginase [Paenibacillus barcinonensis]